LYVLAMMPHALVMVWLIDAITGERRSLIATYSLYLVACTFWRWVGLARMQYEVQRDVADSAQGTFWRRLPQVMLIRLFSHIGVTWGGLLAGLPAFYGLYAGSFAAPLLFETNEPLGARLRQMFGWIRHSSKRLFRMTLAMAILIAIVTVGLFVSQFILTQTILPSLLGLDTVELNITFASWSWRLRLLYFIFLVFDAFWTVAAVFVYYDSQSRRMATDLRARLQIIADLRPS
jgi:hypothetical protein